MEENEIKSKAFSGVFWKFLERIGAQLVSLVVSIVLARILSPSDYSVVGVVLIFFSFANVFISGGLNTALMQKKEIDVEEYSTVLYVSVILSVVIYLILFFCAPLIASLYNQEILIIMIRVMGLSLPINAIKSIWCAYISVRLQFRKFFFATFGGTIASAVVGICMALNGAGAWALVAQQMTNIVIDTLVLVVSTRIHIVIKISIKKLKVLFQYGWKVFVSSVISVAYNEIVPLVVGVKYTNDDLSYYTKGRSFPALITTTTTTTLSAVMFPTLAKFQDDKERLLKYTRLFIQLSSFVVFPLMLGFLATAENFISVVLTDKWLPAAPYIKIFCIAYMFDMIHMGNCETIKAMGKSGVFLVMEIIKKSSYFIVLAIFLFCTHTPETLALSFIVCTVIAIIVNAIPNRKLLQYRFRYQIADILPNLITSLIMCGAVILIGMLKMSPFLCLATQVAVGGCVYLALNFIIGNSSLKYIIGLMQKFLHRKKQI